MADEWLVTCTNCGLRSDTPPPVCPNCTTVLPAVVEKPLLFPNATCRTCFSEHTSPEVVVQVTMTVDAYHQLQRAQRRDGERLGETLLRLASIAPETEP